MLLSCAQIGYARQFPSVNKTDAMKWEKGEGKDKLSGLFFSGLVVLLLRGGDGKEAIGMLFYIEVRGAKRNACARLKMRG